MAAAMRSGNKSGVQAKAGMPRAAKAAAWFWSNMGAPSSLSASRLITCRTRRTVPRRQRADALVHGAQDRPGEQRLLALVQVELRQQIAERAAALGRGEILPLRAEHARGKTA